MEIRVECRDSAEVDQGNSETAWGVKFQEAVSLNPLRPRMSQQDATEGELSTSSRVPCGRFSAR
jgi:hypothetical protein